MNICGHKEDSEVYKDASKQLLLTYNDFAMECFRQRQFDSAITLLNRAIKQEKREKGLYLNRGGNFSSYYAYNPSSSLVLNALPLALKFFCSFSRLLLPDG